MVKRKTVVSNMIWRFMEQCGSQGVSFVVALVLARILSPSDYGTVALITVIMSLLSVFINSGMGLALIQKKDADDLDFSTLFYFNMTMCTILYVGLYFCAPWIASFYHNEQLIALTRVIGLTFIVSGVKSIQHSFVAKNLMFKRFFWATLGGTVGAAIIGVYMALKGYGCWALVAQSLFNNVIDTLILWLSTSWRPKWMFSFERLKQLFSFGSKILVINLINRLYKNIRSLLIARFYSPADLAFFRKGSHYAHLIENNVGNAIDSVMLPVMSRYQNDIDSLRSIVRRSLRTTSFLIFPLMALYAACAEPLIRLVLTEKWLPAVYYTRIFCISYAIYPVNTANLNAIKALGKVNLLLKLDIIKKTVGIIGLAATLFISVRAIAGIIPFTTFLIQFINAFPNKKLLGYSYKMQLADLVPQTILSTMMFFCVFSITFLGLNDIATLCIQVPLGAIFYLVGAKVMKIESLGYVIDTVKSYLLSRKAQSK